MWAGSNIELYNSQRKDWMVTVRRVLTAPQTLRAVGRLKNVRPDCMWDPPLPPSLLAPHPVPPGIHPVHLLSHSPVHLSLPLPPLGLFTGGPAPMPLHSTPKINALSALTHCKSLWFSKKYFSQTKMAGHQMLVKCLSGQFWACTWGWWESTSSCQLLGATRWRGVLSWLWATVSARTLTLASPPPKDKGCSWSEIWRSTIWSLPASPTTSPTLYPNFNETFLLKTHPCMFQSAIFAQTLLLPRWHYIVLKKANFGIKQKWLKSQAHYWLPINPG